VLYTITTKCDSVITESKVESCLNCGKQIDHVMGSCRNCGAEKPADLKDNP
jgi:predicted amidophosphoribosyltransferase